MNSEKRQALNLDELYGQSKTVIVTHNGKDYEFMRIEALGPRQAAQLQKMQKRSQVLQLHNKEITEKESLEIEDVFSQMINMLCPTFPVKEIEFMKKMRIVTFYIEETNGKKALAAALNKAVPIGRKHSRK